MASLRSIIRDGRVTTPRPEQVKPHLANDPPLVAAQRDTQLTVALLHAHDTVLVNADSVARDIFVEGEQWNVFEIPCPKPPFPHMWLEIGPQEGFSGHSWGFLVVSKEMSDATELKLFLAGAAKRLSTEQLAKAQTTKTLVRVLIWAETNGKGSLMGDMTYWLNAAGDFLDSAMVVLGMDGPKNADSRTINFFGARQVLVLHTFARMNCRNVKLVPMTAGGPKFKKGSSHPPFSVWHEIAVSSEQQLRREQKGEVLPDGEKRELRFHRVRGHYADYTKGSGLFGKLKIRIWIEEHTVGEPELGTVKSKYKVV